MSVTETATATTRPPSRAYNYYDWQPDKLELLRDLVAQGLTSNQIEQRLPRDHRGIHASRSAIMSQIMRRGLKLLNVPGRHKGYKATATTAKPGRKPAVNPNGSNNGAARRWSRPGGGNLSPLEWQPTAGLLEHDQATPMAQRRTILTLTARCCHWPVGDPGDPGFFYCGATAARGHYCAYHSRVAFTTVPKTG